MHPPYHRFAQLLLLTVIFTTFTIMLAQAAPRVVLVSGAGGQTGQLLFRKLLARPDEFAPIGLVRTPESKQALLESCRHGEGTGTPPDENSVVIVDVTDAAAVRKVIGESGCSALCICTSATPKPTGAVTAEGRPIFGFPENGTPEQVDWLGQVNQIDACPAGTHVVLCSSMGGTDPNHSLNALGRVMQPDGSTTGGNILKWKRKTEVYLIQQHEQRGLSYTIVHPGGLLNAPGGERELVLGVDDSMEGTDARTVPREDVAEVMLQALHCGDLYKNRSFDLRAKPPAASSGEDEGTTTCAPPTTDFAALIQSLGDKNCDYTLGETA